MRRIHSYPKKKYWLWKNRYKITVLFITLLSMAYMWKHAAQQSLWCDELWQIGDSFVPLEQVPKWLYTSIHGLFYTFSYFWYKIAPYGEQWLKLPSIISTGIGIYLTGLCGYRLKNGFTGVLAAFFIGFSRCVMKQCGMDYRMYGFVLLFSAWLLYLFLGHIQKGISEKNNLILLRFAVMWALSMNHLFGCLLCGTLFLIDVYFFWKKRVHWKSLVIYPVLFSFYMGALIAIYIQSETGWDKHSWMTAPGWSAVYQLLKYLAGDMQWSYILFIVSIVWHLSAVFREYVATKRIQPQRQLELLPAAIIAIMVSIEFCFAWFARLAHLNGTLWVNRYFTGIIPCAALICALGVQEIIEFMGQKNGKMFYREAFAVLVLCTAPLNLMTIYQDVNQIREPYREAAEWLYEQKDIFEENVVVITSAIPEVTRGWTDYYLTRQGQRKCFSLLMQSEILKTPDLLNPYKKIYIQSSHFELEEELLDLLEKDFYQKEEIPDLNIAIYHRIVDFTKI